jgi:prepilin-type N-terminal cleavage/methylation domain-containing protein
MDNTMGLCQMWRSDMKPVKKNLNTERGFTLVEIMVAICVFSIGMLAVASMQVSGTNGTANAKWHTGATAWASDQTEKIISLPYDHPDLTDGAHAGVTEDQYAISWDVQDDALVDNTKTITVTVAWDGIWLDRTISFVYYKADV